jgi:hypothetical protein
MHHTCASSKALSLHVLLLSSTVLVGCLLQVLLDSEGIDAYDQVGMQQWRGTVTALLHIATAADVFHTR